MIYNLIISPIELIVDWIFTFMYRQFTFMGVLGALVGVSLVINFLALPIYNLADEIQEKDRQQQKKMQKGIERIKSVFFGDERFMILQTFYRENHYHPLYAFKSSLSILIEIPFFIAAYHYLSNCEILKDATITPPPYIININLNLGSPDQFFSFVFFNHTLTINLLPILMTVINIISAAFYLKDSTKKEKIQTVGLAVIFLVLLYNSPSGLVIYWISNNIFSLFKNVIKNQKNPGKILFFIISILAISFCSIFWLFKPDANILKKILLTVFVLFILLLPLAKNILKNFTKKFDFKNDVDIKPDLITFLMSALGISLLLGLTLPSNLIASDPISFSFLGKTENPLSYLRTSGITYIGLFILWPFVIYNLLSKNKRRIFSKIYAAIFLSMLCNAFIFKYNYGTINILFNIEEDVLQASYPLLYSLSLLTLFVFIFFCFYQKTYKVVNSIVTIICIAQIVFIIKNTSYIKSEFSTYKANIANRTQDDLNKDIEAYYHLSKKNKNVLVIFIDKAVGAFFPILQKEYPEISNNFEGFVFYPNTASFGPATLYGSPSMLGGYDYTPEKINQRSDVLLRDKHNEASLIMPLNFLNNNYDVTVTDPPLPNFTEEGDLSAFLKYPKIRATEFKNVYTSRYKNEVGSDTPFDIPCRKGIINFSMLQVLHPAFRNSFYKLMKNTDSDADDFFKSFPSLYYLNKLTDFTATNDTFTFIGNETPHFATYMNKDNFTEVSFEKDESSKILNTSDTYLIMNYHSYIATLKQLGNWCKYLIENNCYDNTRIIIVSDHGHSLNIPNSFNSEEKFSNDSVLSFNPLLLVKDFNCHGNLSIDNRFMTNADTVFLAFKDLISQAINPFLQTELKQEKDNGIHSYFVHKGEHNPMPLQKTKTLTLDNGFFIKKDLFDVNSWEKIDD